MKWARELVEPNRSEAARVLGVDTSTLTKIEAGTRAPTIFLVIQYANRYRVSTDYLLRGQLKGRMDEEMMLKLAALHPELVLDQRSTDLGMGTAQGAGRHRLPMRPDPVN